MSQDLGRVGTDFGRARGHSSMQYTWRRRRGKRTRMAMIPESSVLGDSTHDRISPEDGLINAKKNRAGTTRLQRVQRVSQTSLHPVRDLGACAAGKAPKAVLIGCEGRGIEAVSTCSAEGQSKLLLILLKMRCVWFGFEMTPSTDRTPYCAVLQ